MSRILSFIFFYLIQEVCVLENGLARTPPMGWMSWGYYMCGDDCEKKPHKCLDEILIQEVADIFSKEGYQEAGYEYVIIDDCWSEKQRDDTGHLVANNKRFPRGMKYLGEYVHRNGLKFGMYTNIAKKTCMSYPGSRGYFEMDSYDFATWGVDYLKVDGCFVSKTWLDVAYKQLGQYLNHTGRPMVYSCSWPYYMQFIHHVKPDLNNIMPHCNLWRNYHDVFLDWQSVRNIIKWYEENYSDLLPHHGPGHWNDPDMLIFGTGALNEGQSRIQLGVYAMLSAPLLLSCDMKMLSDFERSLLLNMELIAIDQDPLGKMAKPYRVSETRTMWVKQHLPIKGDVVYSYSFAFVNFDETDEAEFTVRPSDFGLSLSVDYIVMDVFLKKYIRNITINENITVTVPHEDIIIYTIYPL